MNVRHDFDALRAAVLTPEALETALAAARTDVRVGLFTPDYGLPQRIISSCLDEAGKAAGIDAGAIIREKLSKYVETRKLPILTDLKGRALCVDDFPQYGDDLTDERSVPIVERLRQRLLENPSSGGIAQCFEHHLHYGLGKSARLTAAQVRFVTSVCALANRRPHTILWLSQFVHQRLDSPQRIRDLLTIIHQHRQNLPIEIRYRLAVAFPGLVSARRWRLRRSRPFRVLLVGYSRSAIEAVGGLAQASASAPVLVSIADVQRPERWPQPTHALRTIDFLRNVHVEHASVPALSRTIRDKRIDYVVTGFKALQVKAGQVSFVVSGPCADVLKAASGLPIILTGGLDKVWPRAVSGASRTTSGTDRVQDDEVWGIDKVAWVATEEGVQRPAAFADQPILKSLLNAGDIEMFYALLISRHHNDHNALLADGLSRGASIASPVMPLSNAPPSKELLRQLKRYMADAKDNSQFFAARNAFRRRVAHDDAWFETHRSKYVAMLVGPDQTDEYASDSFWNAFAAAHERWPGQMFYLGKVQRPLPPNMIVLRNTSSGHYPG